MDMEIVLADLWDAYPDELLVCEAQFRGFGRRQSFAGPCMTVKAHEDHRPLRDLVATPGGARVLVVDAGGSLRVAAMGDRIAAAAAANGWVGAIIYGAIRDTAGIDALDFGVKALGTTARRGEVPVGGAVGVPLSFAGLVVKPGDWVYADRDAVAASVRELRLPRD
jgi:regulator of ribonuclease activity A